MSSQIRVSLIGVLLLVVFVTCFLRGHANAEEGEFHEEKLTLEKLVFNYWGGFIKGPYKTMLPKFFTWHRNMGTTQFLRKFLEYMVHLRTRKTFLYVSTDSNKGGNILLIPFFADRILGSNILHILMKFI